MAWLADSVDCLARGGGWCKTSVEVVGLKLVLVVDLFVLHYFDEVQIWFGVYRLICSTENGKKRLNCDLLACLFYGFKIVGILVSSSGFVWRHDHEWKDGVLLYVVCDRPKLTRTVGSKDHDVLRSY